MAVITQHLKEIASADNACIEVVVHLGNILNQSLHYPLSSLLRHAQLQCQHIAAILTIRASSGIVKLAVERLGGLVANGGKLFDQLIATERLRRTHHNIRALHKEEGVDKLGTRQLAGR